MVFQTGEIYSRLASGIKQEEWSALEAALDGRAGDSPLFRSGATLLGLQKTAAEHWSPILMGVRQISDEDYVPGPVSESVVSLERLTTMAARVRFASGERHGGVTLLLDGLKMARRIQPASPALGSQCQQIALLAFAKSMDAIPLLECDRVRGAADEVLAETKLSVKEKSQFGLLRLHMRIEAYRWKYLKLPERLSVAAPVAENVDFATGSDFRYEITPTGYRLRSESSGILGAS